MSSAELGRKSLGNRMPIHNWAVADNAARDAITTARSGVALSAADIGRVCRVGVTSPFAYYVLEGVGPLLWSRDLGAEPGDSGGGGVTDHGALTGLDDDDHPQYAKADDMTTALAAKADASAMTTALAAKADTSAVTSALALKADTTALTSGLAGKANTSHTHAIADITTLQAQLDAINAALGGSVTETPMAAASYAFVNGDAGKHFVTSHAGPEIPFTIPTDATFNFPIGTTFYIRWGGVGRPGLVPANSAVTTLKSPGQWLCAAPNAELQVRKTAANFWNIVSGYSTAKGLLNLSASAYSQNNLGTPFVAGSASGFHVWFIYVPYKLPVSHVFMRRGSGTTNGYQISTGGGGQIFGQVMGTSVLAQTLLLPAFTEAELGKPVLIELVSTGTTINIYKNGVAAGADQAITGYTAPSGAALIASVGGLLGAMCAWGGKDALVPTAQNLVDHYTQCKAQWRGVDNPVAAGTSKTHNVENFGYIFDGNGSGERFSLEGTIQFANMAGITWP